MLLRPGLVSSEVEQATSTGLDRILDQLPSPARWLIPRRSRLKDIPNSSQDRDADRRYRLLHSPEDGISEIHLQLRYRDEQWSTLFSAREERATTGEDIYELELSAISDNSHFAFVDVRYKYPLGGKDSGYWYSGDRENPIILEQKGFQRVGALPEVIDVRKTVADFMDHFRLRDFQAPELVGKKA